MHIAWLWGCAPAQVKREGLSVSCQQATWKPDDFGMVCFKAKAREVLISSGLHTLDEMKKLTIHQIIWLVDKKLGQTEYKEREQSQTQWKSELREAYETALEHKEYWQQRVREAIALVKQWYQDYSINGKEIQRVSLPYMESPYFRKPDIEDLSWMYWVLGMKLQDVFDITRVFIPDDVEFEMVSLFRHIEKPVWEIVRRASLEDFKTYWGYVAQDMADLPAQKPPEKERNAAASPINIQNSNVILGDIHQPGNLQVGDHKQIQEQTGTEEKKSGGVRKLLKIIAAIVGFFAASLTCLGYLLDWRGPIMAFIYRILTRE